MNEADVKKFAIETIKEIAPQIYKDLFSPSVGEIGDVDKNIIKTFRFLFAGFDIAAAYQDRFQNWVKHIAEHIPKGNLQQGSLEISGRSFEALKWVEKDSLLESMFLNLITASMDKDRSNSAHPAFVHYLKILSPDEAKILLFLKGSPLVEASLREEEKLGGNWIKCELLDLNMDIGDLNFPDNFFVYIDNLTSYNLVNYDSPNNNTQVIEDKDDINIIECHFKYKLSEFGKLFSKACMPGA